MHVAIVGTGLIGASIGLGLRQAGWKVTGWDRDAAHLETARRTGALDRTAGSLAELAEDGPDVLVLATPLTATVEYVGALAGHDGLVIDVAAVKTPVMQAGAELPRFVGTHPMAGREVSGPEAAGTSLFRGAAWVVVPGTAPADDLATVARLIQALGARPVRMTAKDHDVAVAVVSHLPHVVAAALVAEASGRHAGIELAAGGFRDLTRIAASDTGPWIEVLTANRDVVVEVVREFGERLRELESTIAAADRERLASALERARTVRRSLAAPTSAVRVALADRPGELVKVGRALETAAVDVRDLQLRHSAFGGGGVLTISVGKADAAPLREALADQGLFVVE